MNEELMHSVAARWVKLGVMLNVQADTHESDLERLLLDTARVSSANSRLFTLAVTWLADYGIYVDCRRLTRLIECELEKEFQPTLGLLLELAAKHSKGTKKCRFKSAIKACTAANDPHPLFDVERRNSAFIQLARQRASETSRKWGRWSAEIELKSDAIRPLKWVVSRNPLLANRAMMSGLKSQIIAECVKAGGRVNSISELAMKCGVSRPAARNAIEHLELAGKIRKCARVRARVVDMLPRYRTQLRKCVRSLMPGRWPLGRFR